MVILLLLLNSMAVEPAPAPAKLPYDRTCPVIYDNDYANDYVDWYLMALASAGGRCRWTRSYLHHAPGL